MRPADLERELEADPGQRPEHPPAAPVAQPAAPAPAPVERRAPTLWEEAAVLRRLLFSANVPVAVGAETVAPVPAPSATRPGLAPAPSPARVLPRHLRGRRRR